MFDPKAFVYNRKSGLSCRLYFETTKMVFKNELLKDSRKFSVSPAFRENSIINKI